MAAEAEAEALRMCLGGTAAVAGHLKSSQDVNVEVKVRVRIGCR
jgi:hypothetical protein